MSRALLVLVIAAVALLVTYSAVLDSIEEQYVGIAPERQAPPPVAPEARPGMEAPAKRVSESVVEAVDAPESVAPVEPGVGHFSVVGVVKNDEGLRLSGVRVTLSLGFSKVYSRRYGAFYAWHSEELASTLTNQLGEYEFDLRPHERHPTLLRRPTDRVFQLRATMPGYIDVLDDFPIPAERRGVTEHDVVFVPGEMRSGLVYCNDRPVADAEVLLLDFETSEVLGRTETNRQGEYRIAVREAGTYDFLAREDGFGVGVHRGLTVPLGQRARLPDLHLEGVGLLAGTVRFPDAKAVAGLRLLAVPEEFGFGAQPHVPEDRRIEVELEGAGLYGSETLTVPSGEHMGRFEFRGLKPGRYRLTFPSHPEPELQAVEVHDSGNESIDITYTNPRLRVVAVAHDYGGRMNDAVEWIDPRSGMKLSQPSSVRIELDVARIFVSDEGVRVQDSVPGPPSMPSSGAAFFEVEPAAEYLVRARGVGLEETYVTLETPARITETTATLFLYPFGYDGPREAGELHDPSVAPRLCFVLVDPSGEPIEGVPLRATLRTADGDALGSLTDLDVSSFAGGCVPVPPGVYTHELALTPRADSFELAPEPGIVEAVLGEERRVRVTTRVGGRLRVEAHWPKVGNTTHHAPFSIRLEAPDGEPIQALFWREEGEPRAQFPSRGRSAETLPLPAGRYELVVREPWPDDPIRPGASMFEELRVPVEVRAREVTEVALELRLSE